MRLRLWHRWDERYIDNFVISVYEGQITFAESWIDMDNGDVLSGEDVELRIEFAPDRRDNVTP